jgi:hypothetical protein
MDMETDVEGPGADVEGREFEGLHSHDRHYMPWKWIAHGRYKIDCALAAPHTRELSQSLMGGTKTKQDGAVERKVKISKSVVRSRLRE